MTPLIILTIGLTAVASRAGEPPATPTLPSRLATPATASQALSLPETERFRDLRKSQNWSLIEAPHIALYYLPGRRTGSSLGDVNNDPDTVAQKLAGWEDALAKVCAFLHTDPPPYKVAVFLFPDAPTQGRAFGEKPFVGSACQGATITSEDGNWPASGTDGLPNDLHDRAFHELTHAVAMARITDDLPDLMHEGLAVWVQRKVNPNVGTPDDLSIISDKSLHDLLKARSASLDDAGLYGELGGFFDFLYQRGAHSPDSPDGSVKPVKAFLLAIGAAKGKWAQRVDTAARSVYGARLDTLDREWRDKDKAAKKSATLALPRIAKIPGWRASFDTRSAKGAFDNKPLPGDVMEINPAEAREGQPHLHFETAAADRPDRHVMHLMQFVRADAYRGKRLRLSANVRCRDLKNIAFLSAEARNALQRRYVPSNAGNLHTSDQMFGHWMHGSKDWHRCEVVIDVPPDANFLLIGLHLDGAGELWVSGMQVETVDAAQIAATDGDLPKPTKKRLEEAEQAWQKNVLPTLTAKDLQQFENLHLSCPTAPVNLALADDGTVAVPAKTLP